jgi:beta-lactamase class A
MGEGDTVLVPLRILSSALLALTLVACATTTTTTVDQRIDRIIAAHPDKTIAVAYCELDGPSPGASRHPLPANGARVNAGGGPSPRVRGEGGRRPDEGPCILRNEHVTMHAASTMKVPVMFGIFEAVTRGELRLDQPVRVKNDFVSIFDGSHYALEAREDSDPELYGMIGRELPLEELVRRMIDRSSNLATNIVIEFIGAPRIMELMKSIGANDIRVLRGVEDDKAYHAGMNNTTTAFDLMLIFRALGEGTVISREASDRMIAILLAQEHNDGIPAGLPPGTRVAHKTGWITEITHDAGIVFRPDGSKYVLVVLTRGFKKEKEAKRVQARIARATW